MEYIIKQKVVSESFNLQEIYVRSTDFHRTISSAQATLMGLYPNGPEIIPDMKERAIPPFLFKSLNETIKNLGNLALPNGLQPIPIDIISKEIDHLLLGYGKSCNKF